MTTEGKGLEVPKTRIASLFVALNTVSAALVAVTAVLGLFVSSYDGFFYFHLTSGLAAASIGLFALVASMFYLVVTGMGIREAVSKHGISGEYFARTRNFKSELFPWCMGAALLLMLMTVLGGGVHVKKISKYWHLAFSVATIAVYVVALKKMKKAFSDTGRLIAETLDAIDKKAA